MTTNPGDTRSLDRLTFDLPFAKNLSGTAVRAHSERLAANAVLAVWRRRYLVLACVVLSLLAAASALSSLERKYVSEAVVRLDLSRQESGFGSDQAPVVMLDANALIQSEARIIQSRLLARRVVEKLGLADDPAYSGTASGFRHYLAVVGAMATEAFARIRGKEAPEQVASPVSDAPSAEMRMAHAIADVMRRLSVRTDPRSYLVTVIYSSPDPALSARVANAVAEEYLQQRMQTNIDTANRTIDWLATQIRETTAALWEAEADIAAFRKQTGVLEPGRLDADAENVQQQQLRALTSQLTAASLARLNEERRLARVQELLKTGHLPSAVDLQGSPLISALIDREATARRELGELLSRFGSRHPNVRQAQAGIADLRSRIDAEVKRAVSVIGSDLAAARQMEEELKERLDLLQRAMIAGKANETELRNRQAKTQAIRDRLATLTRSSEQALAARDLKSMAASLVIPAEAEQFPSSPKPLIVIALALVGGFGTGVTAATLAERRDQGLRTSEDIRGEFDTRCLGMVPELSVKVSATKGRQDRAIFDEAIYSVGAGISLFGAARDCRVVLVTSSVPGEGKSTLCMALAQALVAAGQRVMLVNSPPTRGACQETPPAAPLPGGTMPPSLPAGKALVILDRKHPFMLTAGVFGPGGFGSLLQEARKHFDVILLEGAPVMLVADSLVLGRLADTVIHVTRWANTKQRIVDAALRRLREHSIVVDGLVLTRVDLRRHARLRFLDEGFFYTREKRFYERLAKRPDQTASPPPGTV